MVTANDRTRALHLLHRIEADLKAEQARRPSARWLTSATHSHEFNEALLLLAEDLGERYVHAQRYGTTRQSGHLLIGPVPRDQLLIKVQEVLQRIEVTYA
jgi:hypothetical protein